MDYLIYVDHGAEHLQFLLWYSTYVGRWSKLPTEERSLSPKWKTHDGQIAGQTVLLGDEEEMQREKLDNIIRILEDSCISDGGSHSLARSTPTYQRDSSPADDKRWPSGRRPSHNGRSASKG